MHSSALTDTVSVSGHKYGPCPLDLTKFKCADTPQRSFVRRVCYDEANRFETIRLNNTWYPYCEIGSETIRPLLSAPSLGRYFNQSIRSNPDGSHGPFDCRDHAMPSY